MEKNQTEDNLGQLSSLFETQSDEVEYWRKQIQIDGSQHHRRAFCRSLFSMIEGTTYLLKQSALDVSNAGEVFSPAEMAMLNDEGYELDSKGMAKTIPKYLPTLSNLKFSIYAFSKSNDSIYSPDYGSNDWQNVQKAFLIRNRLTHPKSNDDLNLSDADLASLKSARDWYVKAYALCLVESIKKLREKTKNPYNKSIQPAEPRPS